MVETEGCKSLPEIEIANAEGEGLKISSVSQYDHDANLARILFETSYPDNFVIHLIVLKIEHDVINHVCHLFEDCHDDKRKDLP